MRFGFEDEKTTVVELSQLRRIIGRGPSRDGTEWKGEGRAEGRERAGQREEEVQTW